MNNLNFKITEESELIRVDQALAGLLDRSGNKLSRSYIQKLIKDGNITVNGIIVKPSYILNYDDEVVCDIPEAKPLEIVPENIPLDIVYEDDDLIIVNKPKDMVVHPASGHYTGTLVNAIMYHCGDKLSGINGVLRPGIVHRIDKDTTGLLIICKNDKCHNAIADQLKVHSSKRIYHALCWGNIKEDEGTVNKPIGRHPTDRLKMAVNEKNGKEAETHYKVIERFGDATYIELKLKTGRTHQIRVHMASIGHPLLGDPLYGRSRDPYLKYGQVLHAKSIGFIHPGTGEEVFFDSELPEYFTKIIESLRK